MLALLIATALWAAPQADAELPPNIVLILADDLGYGDLGCQGHPYIETPAIDRLARDGARLTSFYTDAPVCSPTRASLLTGQVPQRHGLTNVIETTDHTTHLAAEGRLLSEMLQAEGYATACIGKWHLGEAWPFRPQRRGFDRFFGNLLGGLDYFRHDFIDGRHDLWSDDVPVRYDGRYVTDLLAEQAVEFVEQPRRQPFFLYLPFEAVHTSMGSQNRGNIQATPAWIAHYADKLNRDETDRAVLYAACVSAMDDAVGRVLAAVDQLASPRSTLVLFTSDNGPEPNWTGTGGAYRGTKHTLWEGGIRVPMLVRWNGRIAAGRVIDLPATTCDVLPTLLAAAGSAPPTDVPQDGANLLPLLTGKIDQAGDPAAASPPRTLCWSYIRETLRPSRERAVRQGRWKWLNGELYDLTADPGESRDLAGEHPEIAQRLAEAWQAWIAQFPVEQSRWGDLPPLRR